MTNGHSVPLPGTEWSVWRDVLLRSTGFPADGLDRLGAPGFAEVADAFLDGRASEANLSAALESALADGSQAIAAIAADPLFREAVTWQNPAVANVLDRLTGATPPSTTEENTTTGATGTTAKAGKSARRARQKQRAREDTVVRYWQRYCGKNDTIGFFGPVAWGTLDPDAPAVDVRPGGGLLRSREVFSEFWALEAYVEHLRADPLVRPWLPVGIHPHLTVDGPWVLRPDQPPLPLTETESDVLSRCDGHRPAATIATEPKAAEALDGLIDRDVVWQGVNLPYNPGAERVLRATLDAIGDPTARERALSGLARLDLARAAVAAAAGDADELAAALARLDAEFRAVTGAEPERRQGQMYAGRRICYEETVRDVDLTFGGPILQALSGPLGRVLLPASRWLSAALADAYDTAFRALYDKLLAAGAPSVPLSTFWQGAQPLLTGAQRPADAVATEFARRWIELFGIDELPPATGRLTARSADLADGVARLFSAERPGWAGARIHSPDVTICAPSAAALARGEFTLVLGEMHAAWPTLDCAVFADRHPDPARLRAAAAADIGPQFRPLYPTWWPRYTARIAPVLGVTDHQLAFAAAPGADPARLLPITALSVTEGKTTLEVRTTDGRSWPLREVFALLFGWLGTEAFKLTNARPHNPRITVDRLVVARETWRTTAGETGLVRAHGRQPEYLAARRLRRALGLPERVFAKIGTEVKPVYVDFTGPRYVSAFTTMLRAAREAAGDDVPVVISELLPGPEGAWLPDADGRRYASELRLQCCDPVRP